MLFLRKEYLFSYCAALEMRYKPAIIDKRLLRHVAERYSKPVNEIFNDPKVTMFPEKSLEDRKNEKLLFEVLKTLPNWGVGRHFVFKQDMPDDTVSPTYWKITRVLVDQCDQDFNYGVAWGVYTWKGWCEEYEKEIPRVNRHGWRLIPKLDEHLFTKYVPKSQEIKEVPLYFRPPPLLNLMLKEERLKEGKSISEGEPMIRLLLDRNRECAERQRLEDGTLV